MGPGHNQKETEVLQWVLCPSNGRLSYRGSVISVAALLQLPDYPLTPQNFFSEDPCLSPSGFSLCLRKEEEMKTIRVVGLFGLCVLWYVFVGFFVCFVFFPIKNELFK